MEKTEKLMKIDFNTKTTYGATEMFINNNFRFRYLYI